MMKFRFYIVMLAALFALGLSACAEFRVEGIETGALPSTIEAEQPASSPSEPQEQYSPSPTNSSFQPMSEPEKMSLPDMIVEKEFTVDVDFDGIDDTITIGSSEDNHLIAIKVSNEFDTSYTVLEGYYVSSFITQTQRGDTCLFVSIDYASEDFETSLYTFFGTQLSFEDDFGAFVYDIDGIIIKMKDDIDALGSWHYTRDFTLTDDYTLKPLTDYQIIIEDRGPLHAIKKLPVEMLINDVYIKQMLDKDTYIYPVSTDGKSYLMFKLEDGSEGKIYYTFDADNYEYLINGISESEYFNNISYWD